MPMNKYILIGLADVMLENNGSEDAGVEKLIALIGKTMH
jgi:hypothetical protein